MRIYKTFILGLFIGISSQVHAQVGVGINTNNPRKTLEVAGDMKIAGATSGKIKVDSIRDIGDTDKPAFLIQNATNFVKDVTTNENGIALAYFLQYKISKMDGDWIRNFETNIDSDKYVLVIISAYFNNTTIMSNATLFATPFVSAFKDSGTWQITADYPTSKPPGTQSGTWTIDTVILSRNFSKILDDVNVDLNNSTTGAAGSPIIN